MATRYAPLIGPRQAPCAAPERAVGASESPSLTLEEVFRAELGYVWNSLRRLGVPDRDVEDVAHEVFLVVHRRLADFDRECAIRPWLFGIAFRCAAAYRRRASQRLEQLGEDADAATDTATSSPTADVRLAQHEDHARVWRALDALPLERRAVVVMHDFEEVPVTEIATTFAIPLRTAYSRLRIGREELATALRRLQKREERS